MLILNSYLISERVNVLVPQQLILRQLIPQQLNSRQFIPRQLIHVNLHWDQLSHLNLNLATIDPPTINPSYVSLFRTKKCCSEFSETHNEPTFRFFTPKNADKKFGKKSKIIFGSESSKTIGDPTFRFFKF